MSEWVCLDCHKSTASGGDACPRCGGKLLTSEAITRILEILPEEDEPDPLRPLPPDVLAAATKPESRLDRYILLEVIGQGGMGRVYKSWHTGLEKYVALKVMSGFSRIERDHFLREGRIAASLHHPNIVPVYDLGQTQSAADEIYYLCMELIDGLGITRSKLSREGRLKALATVARALDYSHTKGVIHRDIKPENILIDATGTPFLTDFGLAKQVNTTLTPSSIVFGTPAYMAPEQARAQATDLRADIYSLGATLYDILCGRPPFTGDQPYQIIEAAMTRDPVPPSRLVAGLPRDLDVVCLKALEKEPRQRYGSALEFAEDLERVLAGEPILARPPSWFERARRHARKRPGLLLSGLVALVFIASLVGVQSAAERKERGLRERILRMGRLIDQFDAEYAAPRQDIRPAMAWLHEAVRISEDLGAVAEAYFEKGRALSRLNRLDAAIESLSQAISMSEDPKYFLERGIVYLKIYQEQFDKLLQSADKEEAERIKKDSWFYKDQALADLRRAALDPTIGSGQLEFAQAMLLYTEGDMLQALRRVSNLVRSEKRLRAELFVLAGDIYQSLRDYENAERAYEQAIDIKRSHPEYRRKAGLAALYHAVDTDSEETARRALDHFESALQVDADFVNAVYGRGLARIELARLGGENELLEGAIVDFSLMIEQVVRYRDGALGRRAMARAMLAERLGSRELIELALQDMADVAEHTNTIANWMTYASLYTIAARLHAEAPLPLLDKALELLHRAVRLGSLPKLWLAVGDTLYLRAQHGESVEDFHEALEAYRKELEGNPRSEEAHFNMSQVHFALAYHHMAADPDLSERQIKLAIECIGRCPDSVLLRFERGKMRHLLGTLLAGEESRAELERSLSDLKTLPETHAAGRLERGKVYIARAQLSQGTLDRADLAAARREIKAALALDGSLASTAAPLLGWLKSFLGDDR